MRYPGHLVFLLQKYAPTEIEDRYTTRAPARGRVRTTRTITMPDRAIDLGDVYDWKAGTEAGFDSIGIDDNAPGTRFTLDDAYCDFGPADTTVFEITRGLSLGYK